MKMIQLFVETKDDVRIRNLCEKCGTEVHYAHTKDGKQYLAEYSRKSKHGGNFSPAHRCDLWQENDKAFQTISLYLKDGRIITGQNVEVVKGRNVPVGSKGKIFWIGTNGYGVSVGIELENNEKVFTYIGNIKVEAK